MSLYTNILSKIENEPAAGEAIVSSVYRFDKDVRQSAHPYGAWRCYL